MVSVFKLTYHRRLFLGLFAYSWLLLGCFALFQYNREKQFKAEELNVRLQTVNDAILENMERSGDVSLPTIPLPSDIRVSVIDHAGNVVYDNSLDSLPGTNHLDREEIAAAIHKGEGYALRRHSKSTGNTYFYAAKSGERFIVRTAIPYSVSLHQLLSADYAFLWFMLVVTIMMSLAGFFATRRIGRYVERLRDFAKKAERGDRIYDAQPFPHDELGDISNHIVRMYAKLQQAVADRDRQHKIALWQEREKIRIKRELTNNINHELKTPVAAMQVCLETLIDHPDMNVDKRKEFLERCYQANSRLSRLLADVSVITRIEDGGDNIAREPVDAGRLVAEVCEEFSHMAADKGISIIDNIPSECMVDGNASLLTSVFRNLIDNAIKYSGGSIVTLGAHPVSGGMIEFSVADNGSGVAPEHIERIFERFYRVDKGRSRQVGGTGLGLAIVKNAVLWHGGSITATNLCTGGLEFIFSLPASRLNTSLKILKHL
ncbi:MAG: sensor histidine kinase [Paramuribaculum sp.]|nr:sensor histidine kinase [Paramuribaculum sp.]